MMADKEIQDTNQADDIKSTAFVSCSCGSTGSCGNARE